MAMGRLMQPIRPINKASDTADPMTQNYAGSCSMTTRNKEVLPRQPLWLTRVAVR